MRKPARVRAFIGLGGNLGDALGTFERALAALAERQLDVLAVSSAYRTTPLVAPGSSEGAGSVPDYWNAACSVETSLSARELLNVLLDVERRLGRSRRQRWASRTLDLDLLAYDEQVIDEPDLKVPHPGLADRLFVLRPLAEIAPDALLPRSGASAAELLARHPDPDKGILERRSWRPQIRAPAKT
jgi:2-amino-4-hydroxy-6-hydroxymethyldihydropteridine diphosphokinase